MLNIWGHKLDYMRKIHFLCYFNIRKLQFVLMVSLNTYFSLKFVFRLPLLDQSLNSDRTLLTSSRTFRSLAFCSRTIFICCLISTEESLSFLLIFFKVALILRSSPLGSLRMVISWKRIFSFPLRILLAVSCPCLAG